ncbi:hypothetical protein A3F27_03580 [Candidatus Kaiserbacteria bacterium RIFCSPHIGHO2_12_FULL_53_13]|uniref:Transglycosylase SLT domain-containing protein n=1 Tax=Candidatus Kaiserbacteria bacterium RIFCSPHIGHO2_12_FULL_53_13 TaxID=1798502 RepID=A0A1F6EA74_9BACT|nr:MAG: hypothetical protein A3F27_03580 [Candidatus Kaiserbacteria bacterium RIFCSPHIGHO2_12_FULL_53_13]OGG74577.1 MAG: hypothetical protein A3A37_01245 [Candidatus Kaiserbacteria bacterium RIFCSPLOWO2_01_FULL_52_36]
MTRSYARLFVVLACAGVIYAMPITTHAATAEQRAALQAELNKVEKDISNNQSILGDLQSQHKTLESAIAILDNKIKTAQLQIKQTDLALKQIQQDISDKQSAIVQVDGKVAMGQESLAQILRNTREIDDTPITATMLSSGSISDIFTEIDNFEAIQRALDRSFTEMAYLRSDLSARKTALEGKEDEAQKVRQAQVLARQAVLADQNEKKNILAQTKGQEKAYQQIIADKQKQAAAIRTALFGLRDTSAIPFGTALEYAKQASVGTGVRPAVILAILTQESNLGQNVGSCIVKDLDNGSGVGKNTNTYFRNVMKSPRDTVPFKVVTEALGREWFTTPVSCPQGSGYGGAMGPSQFIPSTWVAYKDRLTRLTGENFPDPWNARTAIFATATYMGDLGADGKTRATERKAALKYFAGGNWNKPANAIYGSSVMDLADRIQGEIDILGG